MKSRILGIFIALWAVLGVCAQPSLKKVQIHLVPDHEDAIYRLGEQAKFKVIALDCGIMLSNVQVDYEVSEDSWNRLDLTFAASGADSEFIGDGSHYSDVYIY